MLVLSRHKGEAIVFQFPEGIEPGAEIIVRIGQESEATKVRLCMTAPDKVVILREELVGTQPK